MMYYVYGFIPRGQPIPKNFKLLISNVVRRFIEEGIIVSLQYNLLFHAVAYERVLEPV